MKISYSPYELKSKKSVRKGALLRIEFSDEMIGYADCHPWRELGDLSLTEQLKLLSRKEETPLTKRALYFARMDAGARKKKINLLDKQSIPMSHFLVMDLDHSVNVEDALLDGFKTFKFKVGKDRNVELACLKKILPHIPQVRLDFNCRLTCAEYLDFLEGLEGFQEKIEFCEDPFPYDKILWEDTQKKTGVSLALDRFAVKNASANYRVLKPAIEEFRQAGAQKLVVTSYAAHPLEQACAAYIASQLKTETCGLQSHYIYERNRFSEELSNKGPYFQAPEGTGFGFDQLLEGCGWIAL